MMKQGDRIEKVTVIMPVYNPGQYLEPCLDSLLLGQTFPDFRIIAIDDGSTDESYAILEECAGRDKRLTVLQNPHNIGAGRTRNIGLQLAQGEYVVILDADDYFEPDYLETLYQACVQNNLDIAVCDYFWRDEAKGEEHPILISSLFSAKINQVFSRKDLPDQLFLFFAHSPFVKMYRRQFLLEWRLQFQDLTNSNDVAFSIMSFAFAERIMHVPKVLIHYRYNTGRQISTKRGRNPQCGFEAGRWVLEVLRQWRGDVSQRAVLSVVAGLIYNALSVAGMDYAVTFLRFLYNEGLPSLSLPELSRDDFISSRDFLLWQSISTENFADEYTDEWLKQVNYDGRLTAYNDFFIEAERGHLRVAHWGYGKLGKEFCAAAQEAHFLVAEVYDKNPAKWSDKSEPKICPFVQHSKDVDIIVMTNVNFEDDIKYQIQDSEIKLFNFVAFCSWGVPFYDCIY